MIRRSYLFVPADSDRKLQKAVDSGADALILDLEDSVALENKDRARFGAAAFLGETVPMSRLVRVNALSTGLTEDDVRATVAARPDAFVLPKCEGPKDIEALSSLIALHGGDESIGIVAIATETVRAVRSLMRQDWSHPRLEALTWGGEDLAADMGASRNRDASNTYLGPFLMARDLTLLAALDANVAAVDSVFTDFRNDAGLLAEARLGKELGFTGKLAIHPAQVPVIHEAFRPDERELAWAYKVVDLFKDGTSGVASLDGQMLDRPHLRQAKKLIDLAAAEQSPRESQIPRGATSPSA